MGSFMDKNIKWQVAYAIEHLLEVFGQKTMPPVVHNQMTRGQKLDEVMRLVKARWGEEVENRYYATLYERLTAIEPLNAITHGVQQMQVVDTFIAEVLQHLETDTP